MESFQEKLERLRAEQAQRDEARQNERPLQPTGVSYEQGRLNRIARAETAKAIEADVERLSDRDPTDPLKDYAEKLKAESKFASVSRKAAIRERLKVLTVEIEKREAAAAESKRLEDYAAHPSTVLVTQAVEALRHSDIILKDIPAEEVEKLRTIGTRHDLFVDPEHGSRMFWEFHGQLLERQIAADEARHAEQAALTSQKQAELTEAANRLNASKARLEQTRQQLGEQPDVQPPAE